MKSLILIFNNAIVFALAMFLLIGCNPKNDNDTKQLEYKMLSDVEERGLHGSVRELVTLQSNFKVLKDTIVYEEPYGGDKYLFNTNGYFSEAIFNMAGYKSTRSYGGTQVVTHHYDSTGLLEFTISKYVHGKNRNKTKKTFEYDSLGRLERTRTISDDDYKTDRYKMSIFKYDARHNRILTQFFEGFSSLRLESYMKSAYDDQNREIGYSRFDDEGNARYRLRIDYQNEGTKEVWTEFDSDSNVVSLTEILHDAKGCSTSAISALLLA